MTTYKIYDCPECGNKLEHVTQPADSLLNADQFDAIRAGDYFCRTCKGDRGNTGMRYYWKSELEKLAEASSAKAPEQLVFIGLD